MQAAHFMGIKFCVQRNSLWYEETHLRGIIISGFTFVCSGIYADQNKICSPNFDAAINTQFNLIPFSSFL
jgi:hypothetical protein